MDKDLNLTITADDDFDGLDLEEDPTTGDSSLVRDKQVECAMVLMPDEVHGEERPAVSEEESGDEDLELRLQLLKEKRDSLKKEKLKKDIRKLEQEVELLAKESKTKAAKPKKKSGEVINSNVTINDLRKSKKLCSQVKSEMYALGLELDSEHDHTCKKANSKSQKEAVEVGTNKQKLKPKEKLKRNTKTNAKFKYSPSSDCELSRCDADSEFEKRSKRKLCSKLKKEGLDCSKLESKKKLSKHKNKSRRNLKIKLKSDSDSEFSSSDLDSESDSSDSSDSSDYGKYDRRGHSSKSSKNKSGIVLKSSDKVKNFQYFPHNFLQFEYVNKDLKLRQLNFKQFLAGELEIISNFCHDKSEKEGRLKLLQKISYFSSIYQWSAILDFYAACLNQIEIGKKCWSDDPQVLESAIFTGKVFSFDKTDSKFNKTLSSKSTVWFCYKYQRNKCEEKTTPHNDTIREVVRSVLHICATCLQKEGTQRNHPECAELCPHKQFGWPIGIKYLENLDLVEKKCRNHTGVRFYPKDIEKYIKKEKTYCAVLGPFKVNPFSDKFVISPLNSVPKSGSAERRVIMDLSHPKGHSVNDCIEKNEYLGDRDDFHYPNVDKLVDIIKSKSQNCLVFKRDLRCAYR
ncbi:unnamed protein product [Mytilus coruscus]|uniref:Uncharacterized protein n=1 Tax=Mytilus coruscus TaxID=42192 RepID=A0A6J8A6H7_MYTCO|nr:unnamed protein product [Mytilus coruscus]